MSAIDEIVPFQGMPFDPGERGSNALGRRVVEVHPAHVVPLHDNHIHCVGAEGAECVLAEGEPLGLGFFVAVGFVIQLEQDIEATAQFPGNRFPELDECRLIGHHLRGSGYRVARGYPPGPTACRRRSSWRRSRR